jgi:hypothetical protein
MAAGSAFAPGGLKSSGWKTAQGGVEVPGW